MKVLLACEESQAVTIKMREIGLEAYSCDLERCSGGHPEWHIQEDVTNLLKENWDLIIAFPPCTHLCNSGAPWFDIKRKDGRQKQGIDFFMQFVTDTRKCKRVAIENPIGIMSKYYREPDQIVHPYHFGESFSKSTCLWLKNLPKLRHTNIVDPGEFMIQKNGKKRSKWLHKLPPSEERSKIRSRTFDGIAQAMTDQWGKGLLNGTLNYIQQSLF